MTPLSQKEREAAFVAIVEAMDRECCVGATTCRDDPEGGIEVRMFLSDERCKRWIAHAQAIEAGTGETREAGLDAKHESAVTK